jgi:soluble lytic murein transglycosylase-like protein
MLGIVAAIMVVAAGFRLVMSTGDVSAVASAKKTMANMFIGYAIVLSGYLLVDFGLKSLVNNSTYAVWQSISCVAQPVAQQWSRPTASGANNSSYTPAQVSTAVSTINSPSSGSLETDIRNAAAAAGITNPTQVNTLRALIAQESSNCQNRVGPPTNSGTAYGCGQMLVSTARSLDPALRGLSDAEVATRLESDNTYNLGLSARYYNQLLTRYNGDTSLALAAYNGGPGANQASRDCPATNGQPALRRWQCVWDSPGCYGTGRTDCTPNQGFSSYAQTRNYVSNITAVAERL